MIAVDAMGGDYAPQAIVEGALRAACNGIPVVLFGNQDQIIVILNELDPEWRSRAITVEHCSQVITMDDEPTRAVKTKRDASLVQAACSVVQGRTQAVVSAGNSGALLVASTLHIGRIDGIYRPAVGGFIPTRKQSVFCLDLGANVDCKPEYLMQFALMGEVFVRLVRAIEKPRVGLLSNGHEPYKGSQLVKQVFSGLTQMPINFIGNIESRDMFNDQVDVLVCDGFTGNILLKSLQCMARLFFQWFEDETSQSFFMKIVAWMNKRVFQRIKRRTDYAHQGGALLLGVRHPVVLAHGTSNARAIENAIMYAHRVVQERLVPQFNDLVCEKLSLVDVSAICQTQISNN